MQPSEYLEQFRKLFPSSRVIVEDDYMKYRFKFVGVGQWWEKKAQKIILQHGLPLTADLEIWAPGGMVMEICLVVKMVPEEHKVLAIAR